MNKYEDYLDYKIDFALESREKFSNEVRSAVYEEIMGAVHFCSVMDLIDDDSFNRLNIRAIEIL